MQADTEMDRTMCDSNVSFLCIKMIKEEQNIYSGDRLPRDILPLSLSALLFHEWPLFCYFKVRFLNTRHTFMWMKDTECRCCFLCNYSFMERKKYQTRMKKNNAKSEIIAILCQYKKLFCENKWGRFKITSTMWRNNFFKVKIRI